jgi:hypothetical protein
VLNNTLHIALNIAARIAHARKAQSFRAQLCASQRTIAKKKSRRLLSFR